MCVLVGSLDPCIQKVSGPELFGSLVGQSEAGIRELFAESELEHRRVGGL